MTCFFLIVKNLRSFCELDSIKNIQLILTRSAVQSMISFVSEGMIYFLLQTVGVAHEMNRYFCKLITGLDASQIQHDSLSLSKATSTVTEVSVCHGPLKRTILRSLTENTWLITNLALVFYSSKVKSFLMKHFPKVGKVGVVTNFFPLSCFTSKSVFPQITGV